MTDSPFVHLAVRSSYSLLESMITPQALVQWVVDQGMPAVAITDRNNLFGALEISEILSGKGVQPIVACCFDVFEGGHRGQTHRLSLYAQNDAGYRRLMYLSSQAYLEASDGVPKLAERLVYEKTDGLIALTGGTEGCVAEAIARGKMEDARGALERLSTAYPGRTYVEIMRHGVSVESETEPGLLELAYDVSLPVVATQDARFLAAKDARAHDAMM